MRASPRDALLALSVIVFFIALFALHKRSGGVVISASATLTPGALNPDVTQRTIRSTICMSGWTRTIRPPVDYTNALKVRQMRAYRETGQPSQFQEDHLISLELGGAPSDPRNLWPEPYPRASAVDKIENELNAKVCSGALSLVGAQRQEWELKHRDG